MGDFSNCYECHDTKNADKPYVFTQDDTIYQQLLDTTIERCGNRKLVDPGKPEESVLYLVLNGDCITLGGSVNKMPTGCYESPDGQYNYCTKHEDRERLRLWIAAGAPEN